MNLDHVLVKTKDLGAMVRFWTQTIDLEVGQRPPFPFPGAWLYSDGKPLIHVAEDLQVETANAVLSHVALTGADYNSLMYVLANGNVRYHETIVPQSQERQVFVEGPDSLVVEMLFKSEPATN